MTDAADAVILFMNINGANLTHAQGDVNRDGIVDGADAGFMFAEFDVESYGSTDLFLTILGHTELYTGRDFDAEVWLQYNRARYYDAKVGRWISEDPIGFAAGDYNLSRYVANSPINGIDPLGLSKLGVELRDRYFIRAGLGALLVPQLITGVFEWIVNYHHLFRDDGTVENAQNSKRARHAFMIENAIQRGVPFDGQLHKVDVNADDIYDTIRKKDYDIILREESPGTPILNTATFWLGGYHAISAQGQYSICLTRTGPTVVAKLQNINMDWGWVDEVDAHSAIQYNWIVDSFGQGILETGLGDFLGDKVFNGNYYAIVGFPERGSAGPYKYDISTGVISSVPKR